jgi:MFS family permease
MTGGSWPSPLRAWGTVLVLMLAYIVSFADRQILALLVGPVKADLGLTDTGFSLLAGLAFALFFTFMGLPFGRLADRFQRRVIVALGTLAGGVAAIGAGLSTSFATLFTARAAAGTADAALGPSAFSMLADLFPPDKRARAFSVYSLGIYIGVGVAFGAGAFLVGAVASTPTTVLPIVGEVRSWQAVFFLIALPSLVLSPLLWLLLREPERRGLAAGDEPLSVAATTRYVWDRFALFGPFFIGFGIIVLANFATLAWTPEFFIRRFGMDVKDAGLIIAATMIPAGSIGVLAGGWFADRLHRRGRRDAVLITGIVAAVGAVIPGIAFPLMPTAELARLMLFPVFFFGAFASGAAPSAIGAVTPNEMRGQVSALYLLVINLLGIGFGPTVPALFTDYLFADEAKLGYSLALTAGVTGLPAIWLLNKARAIYIREAQDR